MLDCPGKNEQQVALQKGGVAGNMLEEAWLKLKVGVGEVQVDLYPHNAWHEGKERDVAQTRKEICYSEYTSEIWEKIAEFYGQTYSWASYIFRK